MKLLLLAAFVVAATALPFAGNYFEHVYVIYHRAVKFLSGPVVRLHDLQCHGRGFKCDPTELTSDFTMNKYCRLVTESQFSD